MHYEFLAEAISLANYIRNRSPSNALNVNIPITIWTGKRATVSHLLTFVKKFNFPDKKREKVKLE